MQAQCALEEEEEVCAWQNEKRDSQKKKKKRASPPFMCLHDRPLPVVCSITPLLQAHRGKCSTTDFEGTFRGGGVPAVYTDILQP